MKIGKSEDPKRLPNNVATAHLRQNRSILVYNKEGWEDVHPIMKRILKERKRMLELNKG